MTHCSTKPGMAKYAHYVGPSPSDPTFRAWWERELSDSERAQMEAKRAGDTRLSRLMGRRINEAKSLLGGRN